MSAGKLPIQISGQVLPVATAADLPPAAETPIGAERVTQDDGHLWINQPTGWADNSVSLGGSIPSAHASSTSVVTSATATYVTAISTTITVTAASAAVYAKATGAFTVTGAVPTVMKYRVSINGVAGQEQLLSLTALTTNYTAAVQYISAALAPGAYSVLFEIARNSGTGTVSFFEGTLDAIALQGASSGGITRITGLGLNAGPGSGSQGLTGTLTMVGGGTNASLTAVNGAVAYSTATALGLTAAGSTGQLLRSAGAASPTWTTATFPATTTINRILYSSAANVITELASANTGALVTSSTGVPSIVAGAVANRLLRTNGTTISFAQAALATDVSGILPGANGGTGVTMFASGRLPFSNGTTYASDALFTYNTATNQFTVGNGAGTGKISGVVLATDPTPNLIAGNFYNRGTNNTVMAQNEGSTAATIALQNSGSLFGASIGPNYSRGTLVARTQSLLGDILFSLITNGHTGAGFTAGSSSTISVQATEDTTSTAQGGELVFSTTPNGTNVAIERLRILNNGDTQLKNAHLKSTQTVAPTVLASANAGTGASATLSQATDVAGIINLTVGSGAFSAGAALTVTFDRAYAVAPIVTICAANEKAIDSAAPHNIFIDNITVSTFDINFGVQENNAGTVYKWNYHVIETQA